MSLKSLFDCGVCFKKAKCDLIIIRKDNEVH